MHQNEQTLTDFYTAFQNRDYWTMQQSYADNAVFNDAVFNNLHSVQVKAMWEMFVKKSKDFSLEFKNIKAYDKKGSAEWTATYSFGPESRKVVNKIKAEFKFENGKITRHTDTFDFYKWASQALGITGKLFGWITMIKNAVRKKAMKNLNDFIEGN